MPAAAGAEVLVVRFRAAPEGFAGGIVRVAEVVLGEMFWWCWWWWCSCVASHLGEVFVIRGRT